MPIQGSLGEMEPGEEGMQIVDVDLDVLRLAEESYKVREDIKGAKWHYGYSLERE